MRERNNNQDISVHAIAGTYVVLLGLNATEKAAKGLLGFTIQRREGQTGEWEPLIGDGRIFKGLESNVSAIHQDFLWGDYVVAPKTIYTYRVVPVYGDPRALDLDVKGISRPSIKDIRRPNESQGIPGQIDLIVCSRLKRDSMIPGKSCGFPPMTFPWMRWRVPRRIVMLIPATSCPGAISMGAAAEASVADG